MRIGWTRRLRVGLLLLLAAGCGGPTAWRDREIHRALQQDAPGTPPREAESPQEPAEAR
ncbi:MAG: hypothetical protein L0216_21750 [Planctomycetales bacterium]|nr:hypothetical protein [Planctomycetales bacterium]